MQEYRLGNNRLRVVDFTKEPQEEFFSGCDLMYVDPPWNIGITKWFYTNNGQKGCGVFNQVISTVVKTVSKAKVAYIEMGRENADTVKGLLISEGAISVERYDTLYAGDKPMVLLRAAFAQEHARPPIALNNLKNRRLNRPELVLGIEKWASCVGDMCTGFGQTARAAHKYGIEFRGTELNPKRLQRLLDWYGKRGLYESIRKD